MCGKILTISVDICVADEEKYERLEQECMKFKKKIMDELNDYDFHFPEKVDITIRSVGGMAS